jgi:hypothetical protein
VKNLKLNPLKNFKKQKIKKQDYYGLKFPLSQFGNFTGIKISNQSDRETLILYFYQLQKLDLIVKVFSNRTFRSYLCFLYGKSVHLFGKSVHLFGKSWVIEVLIVKKLVYFSYQFQLAE